MQSNFIEVFKEEIMASRAELMEKVKCDQKCMEKYKSGDHFKGAKGERFDNCTAAFKECCKGVTSAEGLCATIAPKK